MSGRPNKYAKPTVAWWHSKTPSQARDTATSDSSSNDGERRSRHSAVNNGANQPAAPRPSPNAHLASNANRSSSNCRSSQASSTQSSHPRGGGSRYGGVEAVWRGASSSTSSRQAVAPAPAPRTHAAADQRKPRQSVGSAAPRVQQAAPLHPHPPPHSASVVSSSDSRRPISPASSNSGDEYGSPLPSEDEDVLWNRYFPESQAPPAMGQSANRASYVGGRRESICVDSRDYRRGLLPNERSTRVLPAPAALTADRPALTREPAVRGRGASVHQGQQGSRSRR